MYGKGTRGIRNIQDDGRGLPYRFVSDDWLGGWPRLEATPDGGFTINADGMDGDDVFTGTEVKDEYHGLRGNDTISGEGGKDLLFGDEGVDTIDGGRGDDRLYGGNGEDTIDGGPGDDAILGGAGRDVIRGGGGNDFIKPDLDGGDTIYGGVGDDQILDDFSRLYGGAGNDNLRGLGSLMKGGAGNDILNIPLRPAPNEVRYDVWGGSGADLFYFISTGVVEGTAGVIHDLTNDDLIDLSEIDAKTGFNHPNDQEFELVPEFDGRAGTMTITYDAENDLTLIQLYTDKDMIPESTIFAPGDHADFINFVF